jgi:hypothetical protein
MFSLRICVLIGNRKGGYRQQTLVETFRFHYEDRLQVVCSEDGGQITIITDRIQAAARRSFVEMSTDQTADAIAKFRD